MKERTKELLTGWLTLIVFVGSFFIAELALRLVIGNFAMFLTVSLPVSMNPEIGGRYTGSYRFEE